MVLVVSDRGWEGFLSVLDIAITVYSVGLMMMLCLSVALYVTHDYKTNKEKSLPKKKKKYKGNAERAAVHFFKWSPLWFIEAPKMAISISRGKRPGFVV